MNDKSDKPIPVLYERKELCCGCTACYAICPKSAIIMEPDEEGFLYPVIDEEVCVRCYQCLKVCPIMSPGGIHAKKQREALNIKDSELRKFNKYYKLCLPLHRHCS